ncbi:MAG TPA: hypothetical protein VF462_01725 [Micromonosporaceae bacterium]
MSIVGGVDIHRKQLTFDYVEQETGRWERGRIVPAGRQHLADWLVRFEGMEDVQFAMEGCTGWRYVVEEMRAAGVVPHLAEPADTAALRGRKRRAKPIGRMRSCCVSWWRRAGCPAATSRPRRCWSGGPCWSCTTICARSTPGGRSASTRSASTRAARRRGRPGQAGVIRGNRALLEKIVGDQLSPMGRLQVNTALAVMEALDEHVDRLRRRLLGTARHVHGARVLMHEMYGVGEVSKRLCKALKSGLVGFRNWRSECPIRKGERHVINDRNGAVEIARDGPGFPPGGFLARRRRKPHRPGPAGRAG